MVTAAPPSSHSLVFTVRTVFLCLLASAAVALPLMFVAVVAIAAVSGSALLALVAFLFLVGPVIALLAVLVLPRLVLPALQRRGASMLRPGPDSWLMGIGFTLWLAALVASYLGDRTGSELATLARWCWVGAIFVGFAAIAAVMHRRWFASASWPLIALLGVAFVGLVFAAALPAIQLSQDELRHLPLVVVDETAAAEAGWEVTDVSLDAPRWGRITLEDRDGQRLWVQIDHSAPACGERYSCEAAGELANGTPLVRPIRECRDGQSPTSNLIVDTTGGYWTVTSVHFLSFCDEEPPVFGEETLREVAAWLRPAVDNAEFLAFQARY